MSTGSKKPRERAHLERFRSVFPGFPVGVICETEEPDFIVRTSTGNLGIEHTEFHSDDPGEGGSELKTQESLQERVVNAAVRLYESRNLPNVDVRVHWHPGVQLSRRSVRELPQQLADLVAGHLPGPNGSVWADDVKQRRSHPREIITVGIARLGDPTENQWLSTLSGWIPTIDGETLAWVITKKECRLQSYRTQCDEIWLLIVAHGLAPSSFGQLSAAVSNCEFQTRFDRLFFFRYFDGDYVELRRNSG